MICKPTRKQVRGSIFCVLGFLIALSGVSAYAQQVHQLYYDNQSWGDENLGGPLKSLRSSGIAAFTTTPNNQLHLYYVATDHHIHQHTQNPLVQNGWQDEDLTKEGKGPLAGDTGVAGFSIGNTQYVFYGSKNGKIHLLLYNNVKWTDENLTSKGHGSNWNGFQSIVAFLTAPNNQIHVYYAAADSSDIHQLFFNGKTWSDSDLTLEAGGLPAIAQSMTGFSYGNYQYVFYVDWQSHLHDLYYDNLSWNDVDLFVQIGAPLYGGPGLTSFVVPGTSILEVFYLALTGYYSYTHVTQLASSDNSHWNIQDLTNLTGAPVPDYFSPMTAFVTTPNNQMHVYYQTYLYDNNNHVNQLFYDGSSWSNEDLTEETGSDNADPYFGMAGFSVGNLQYLYYTAY